MKRRDVYLRAAEIMDDQQRTICPDCGNEIDPDVCCCGIGKDNHNAWNEGHTFVPMGCVCGYVTERNET